MIVSGVQVSHTKADAIAKLTEKVLESKSKPDLNVPVVLSKEDVLSLLWVKCLLDGKNENYRLERKRT